MSSRLPVRLQLTLWYTGLLAAALALFSISVYLLIGRSLVSNLDTSLHQRIDQLMPLVAVNNNRMRLRQTGEAPDAPYIPAVLLTRSGQATDPSPPAPVQAWLHSSSAVLGPGLRAASVGGFRIATAPIESTNQRIGYLLVWQSLDPIHQAQRSLLLLFLATGPALLLLAGVGGMLLARRALSPVAQITRAAASISATDLQQRVPVGPADDELSRLAATFNDMIARLESAVERERRFTADASHELRSPLAVILAEASLALEEPLDPEAAPGGTQGVPAGGSPRGSPRGYPAALNTIYEQAMGMRETLAALLMLARAETLSGTSDTGAGQMQAVFLSDVVERAVAQSGVAAREGDVQIGVDLEPELAVQGNATLLVRAVRNLLDNAVKVSPPGSRVRIRTRREGPSAILTVEDEGPGIAREHLEHIFEPFYQVEKVRTPGDSHGLGLAICRRIVTAHGGDIAAESRFGAGARFVITLPAADAERVPVPDRGAAIRTNPQTF